MTKKFLALALAIVMLVAVTVQANPVAVGQAAPHWTGLRFQIGNPYFVLDGSVYRSIDGLAPYIDPTYDRAMLPLRTLAEAMGAYVGWNHYTRTVTISRVGTAFNLQVDTPLPGGMGMPVIRNDRTFVPVRFVSESLGADIHWDEENRIVYVSDIVPAHQIAAHPPVAGWAQAPPTQAPTQASTQAPTPDATPRPTATPRPGTTRGSDWWYTGAAWTGSGTASAANFEEEVRRLINQDRRDHSRTLENLSSHSNLRSYARRRSVDMESGRDSFVSLSESGVRNRLRGYTSEFENGRLVEYVFRGRGITPRDVMNDLMRSASTRADIRDGQFTHIGVGVEFRGTGANRQVYVTVVLGDRAPGRTFRVTIDNDPSGTVHGQSGEGYYASGHSVSIHAGSRPGGLSFYRWRGNVNFTSHGAINTNFVMPPNNVNIWVEWR